MLSHRYLLQDTSLDLEPPDRPNPPNPWQVISSVVAALVATASLITQWKGNRLLAFALVAIALVAAISTFYRPLAASARKLVQNLRRNRVARRSWQEFLRFEKRFGAFLNENDTINLRNIISEICSKNQDEVAKVCGPDYLINGIPVLGQLQPHAREHYQERMKQFRERWVRFLDDIKEFLDKTNHDLRYGDYREEVGTYFEYPKPL